MGPRQEHFRMFALYNQWANRELYQSVEGCSPEVLKAERGAFFHSILGTLNHLLVTDRMWLARLAGNSPLAVRLDHHPYDELSDLQAARQTEDRSIIDLVTSLTEERMADDLVYTTTSGSPQRQPVYQVLAHIFNHQTHHRGQAHDLIGQALGREATPVLDLVYFLRLAKNAEVR